ncbi:MAG TPA: hypothetical protein VNE60_09310 [Gemmatimonadaceae bacterium]|nr:hypothetical protein [Gemmatimonadaceae bacterium]
MIEAFEFVDQDRTFTCTVEEARTPGNEAWWWFRVSTDDRQRYAPFRASARDTQKSVRARIVAYYDDLLVRRAAPPTPYWRRGPGQGGQPAAAAAPAVEVPVEVPVPVAKGVAAKGVAAKGAVAKGVAAKAKARPAK